MGDTVNRFMSETSNLIKSVGRVNASDISLEQGVSAPIQEGVVAAATVAPDIAPELIYAKQEILKISNFSIIFNDSDEFKKHREFVSGVQDIMKQHREKIADAQTKEELVAVFKEFTESCKNYHYSKIKDKSQSVFAKSADTGPDLEYSNLDHVYSSILYNLDVNKPESKVDALITAYSDRNAVGLFKGVVLSNDREDLLSLGKSILDMPDIEHLKAQSQVVMDRFNIPFLKFSEDNTTNVNKLVVFEEKAAEFASRMGMADECIGIEKKNGYMFESESVFYGGYSGHSGYISLAGEITERVIAHEWIHSLDAKVMTDLKTHLAGDRDFNKGDLNKNHVSESSLYPYKQDGSSALAAYKVMADYTTNAKYETATANADNFLEIQSEASKKVLQRALVDTYFSLTDVQLHKLSTGEGADLLKLRVENPKDTEVAKKLESFMVDCVGDNFYAKERIKWFSGIAINLPLFKQSAEEFAVVYQSGSTLKESSLLVNSRNEDENQKTAEFDIRKTGLVTTTNINNPNYYQCNVELIARYTEGQLYPDMIRKDLDGRIYNTQRDERFDDFCKKIVSSCFGEDALREKVVPNSVQEIWHKQEYPNSLGFISPKKDISEKGFQSQVVPLPSKVEVSAVAEPENRGFFEKISDKISGEIDKIANIGEQWERKLSDSLKGMFESFQKIYSRPKAVENNDIQNEESINISINKEPKAEKDEPENQSKLKMR